MEIKNAVIEDAELTTEDHGCLVGWLHLDYGGLRQAFGGYALYLPNTYKYHDIKGVAGHFIYRCMKIAGVSRWSRLKGKTIRVKADHSKIYAIGHIVKDDWFCPEEDFKDYEQTSQTSKRKSSCI